jgi:D-alanine--poly(phosphoribitol) ligase subunit 2
MTTQQAILAVMEEVLGLDQAEMLDNLDLDLFESGLVDSLAMVTQITEVEKIINNKIVIKNIDPKDFLTVNSLTDAIDKQRVNTGPAES